MNKDILRHVNVFQGCGEIDLPEPRGIAASWRFIKGLTGNTHPGAAIPFGKYTCCMYTGGYPTGYGINAINCGGPIEKIADRLRFKAMSHFHHSGTGAIGIYYNYAPVSPSYGSQPVFYCRDIEGENASPGYYSVKLDGILCEATVSGHAAIHRYTFDRGGKVNISVDFASDGLYQKSLRGRSFGTVEAVSPHEIRAEMTLQGVKWYFVAVCPGASASAVYDSGKIVNAISRDTPLDEPMTGSFFVDGGRSYELKFCASTLSMEHAASSAEKDDDFDMVRERARRLWYDALSKIEIETDDARELEIFYSNLYHTLIKPIDMTGESFIADYDPGGGGAFTPDLATLWDIYKTQLPLIFTLYPEISEKILFTLQRLGEITGRFPHCLLLSDNLDIEAKQARMLAEYVIADAYYRGIKGDYRKLLELSEKDAERFGDFCLPRGCASASHTIDMAGAFGALSSVARSMGDSKNADRFYELSRCWRKAYGDDGMMRADSGYYEGNRYNYSFRPGPEAAERIKEYGREHFLREAKHFFGYTDIDDPASRFEGYNNETDMEAPCFCHYLDRDMYCEIVAAGLDFMFTTGRGGIPGNNDSGGLSSCYIWNALGLFPVSGSDLLICGSPRFDRAVMHMPGGDLTIVRSGSGIYIHGVRYNNYT